MKTVSELYDRLFNAIWKKLPETSHLNITPGDVPALLTSLKSPEFEDVIDDIKVSIFNCLEDRTGMGQNALQWVSRHFPAEISNLVVIVRFLDAAPMACLLKQKNDKGNNLLGHLAYWCGGAALQAWLPVLKELNAADRAECLRQRVSGWYIPRFIACAKPSSLESILGLMKGLEPDAMTELITEQDAWGLNLEAYIALYAESCLETFRAVVNFTDSGEQTTVSTAQSLNVGHTSQYGFFAVSALSPAESELPSSAELDSSTSGCYA